MDKILTKYINIGAKVPEDELRANVIKAFTKMGHSVSTVDVKYLGYFAAKRAKGVLRHHYLMRAHIRLKDGAPEPKLP
jgi:hypothetical protein